MAKIGVFEAVVYSTKDKKKLKNGSKTYEYGTIVLRDPKLTAFVGKKIRVTVEETKLR
ncbi:MAG: hypothetical protein NT157_04540 [Candidatus Micrarchaeota archaeon]|nr:hypothetical protein [Candidatus Micrarchaeota archaeon]